VNRIEIAAVRKVVFPIDPEESSGPQEDSKLSAYLDLKIYATARVLRPAEREADTLRVGQSRSPLTSRTGSVYIDQEEILNRVVVVEIERHVDSEGKTQLTPTAVSFTTDAASGKGNSSLGTITSIG